MAVKGHKQCQNKSHFDRLYLHFAQNVQMQLKKLQSYTMSIENKWHLYDKFKKGDCL